jgi:hypothetical protein
MKPGRYLPYLGLIERKRYIPSEQTYWQLWKRLRWMGYLCLILLLSLMHWPRHESGWTNLELAKWRQEDVD